MSIVSSASRSVKVDTKADYKKALSAYQKAITNWIANDDISPITQKAIIKTESTIQHYESEIEKANASYEQDIQTAEEEYQQAIRVAKMALERKKKEALAKKTRWLGNANAGLETAQSKKESLENNPSHLTPKQKKLKLQATTAYKKLEHEIKQYNLFYGGKAFRDTIDGEIYKSALLPMVKRAEFLYTDEQMVEMGMLMEFEIAPTNSGGGVLSAPPPSTQTDEEYEQEVENANRDSPGWEKLSEKDEKVIEYFEDYKNMYLNEKTAMVVAKSTVRARQIARGE